MSSFYKTLKYILLTGLPAAVLICLLMRRTYPGETIYEWIFMIALSGFVGISTNAIAIRMLFRPREQTFFGRHGLIPKNKKKVAKKIAEETEKKLLNVETIMSHIEKGRIIEEAVSSAVKGVDGYLAGEENRKKIAAIILKVYNAYADRIFVWLTDTAEKYLSDFISHKLTIDFIWQTVKPKLKDFFESDELKHRVSTWIINNMIEKVPEISRVLSDVLEKHIEEQVWWKKTVLKSVKEFSGVDRETIARFVKDVFYSPETYSQVIRIVEDNLKNIESFLEQDEVRENVDKAHLWLRQYLLKVTREKAIPLLRERIDTFLESDSSWEIIDRSLTGLLKGIPSKLQEFFHEKQNIEKIRGFLPGLIKRLNIKEIIADNIEQQDTREFENMIMKVTGDNLAAIEVLGGFLGMLAGVAIIMPSFLFILPAGIFVLLSVEYLLTKVKKQSA